MASATMVVVNSTLNATSSARRSSVSELGSVTVR